MEGVAQPVIAADPELVVKLRDAHLLVLRSLQDPRVLGAQQTAKQVNRYISIN